MKFVLSILCFSSLSLTGLAQNSIDDSLITGKITVNKDPRVDMLGKKLAEFNVMGTRSAKGYRLLIMSSNDREKVMSVRAKLLQQFPDQKVYMTFQAPYIKLKFGNFVEKPDAEKFRDQITKARIVTTNVYVVPEVIEVKPDKLIKEKEEE